MIAALLLALAAQAAPDTAPPVVELAPAPAPPPVTPVTPPPVEAPPPETAPAPKKPPPAKGAPGKSAPTPDHRHVEPDGLSPGATAGLQLATGVGGCCAGGCIALVPACALSFIPVAGGYLAAGASALIEGVATGGSEAVAGDVFGQQRAPLLWPILASTVAFAAGSVGTILVDNAMNAKGIVAPGDPQDRAALNTYLRQAQPYLLVEGGIDLAASLVAVGVPVAVYALTAVDKAPGDTGQGFPGLLSPARPPPEKKGVVTVGMTY